LHRIGQALVAVWCVILMVACGGAGELGSGGTGTGSSAALGTVTGLGSVFVDGVRFDDSNAAVQIDNLTDTPDTTEAKIGQRVELAFTFNGVDSVAQTVNIEPELVGAVTAAPTGNGFVVLGQTVVVNTDSAAGPATQFDGGYTGLGDVLMADLVEVHGVPRTTGGVTVIQATRVEKRVAPGHLRVVGVVSGLSNNNGALFNLGGLQVDASLAVRVPAGRALANGQSVVVLALASGLQTGGSAPLLTASRVRIRERANGPELAYVGGVVSNFVANASFNLGGMTVHYDNSVEITPNGATLANGAYVQVRGNFAADGSLNATRIKLRNGILDADLRGTAIGYDAQTKTFTVRDVPVNALTAQFEGCQAGVNNVYVEVKGRIGLTGVVADSVKCSADPAGAIIERRGVASGTRPLLNSFDLTAGSASSITVRWTPLTFFRDVLRPAPGGPSLDGQSLRVEGVLNPNTGVLIATKIRLDH
jgi:Domain of unknown function (DUF5666)